MNLGSVSVTGTTDELAVQTKERIAETKSVCGSNTLLLKVVHSVGSWANKFGY